MQCLPDREPETQALAECMKEMGFLELYALNNSRVVKGLTALESKARVQILPLPLTSCLAAGKSFYLLEVPIWKSTLVVGFL